ncbi:cation acetate symporter [Pseudomonas sp. SLFW]|uniref:solute symporter family protein n=1 Tax=Pseudomonas sp. SLFW TaxID=2683259 RepID=UPI001412118B|nr:cation acetate symporter [Pseudomonas sp. SLFW]NBB13356.1 cation/acetate symporter ActP [Pseudomonas sp. SLFW]
MNTIKRCVAGCIAMFATASSQAADLVPQAHKPYALAAFVAIILMTLVITGLASKKGKSTRDFYTAGGGISGVKNGFAIAGDYLSAAAFLGVSGLIALYGYDGILYLIGFFVALMPVLLFVAEPCRNLGRYTFGDVLAYRYDFRTSKILAATSSVVIVIAYMIPQIVGGAVLLYALLGIKYEVSVVVVGVLMLTYVTFGGMTATTWVQIIKAGLLLTACAGLTVLALIPFHLDIAAFFSSLIHQAALYDYLSHGRALASGEDPTLVTKTFFEPGLYLKNPLEQVSLGLGLTLGTAALPHILMRFFTVKDAQTARKSVLWAMLAIGTCHLLIIFLGFAAAYYVGSSTIVAGDKGGNLAAPLLAQLLGGGADTVSGNVLLGLVAAVAFATIVAVVAGLTLAAASSLAHDVYVGAIKKGVASDRQQMLAGKLAAILVGAVAISASLMAKGQNVAQLVGLAYAIAASANLPALIGTLYWKRCNVFGVVCGVIGGTLAAIVVVLVSPNMQYPMAIRAETTVTMTRIATDIQTLETRLDAPGLNDESVKALTAALAKAQANLQINKDKYDATGAETTSLVGLEQPLIGLKNPGVISIPLGAIFLILGTLLYRRRVDADEKWRALVLRRDSGIGMEDAISH